MKSGRVFWGTLFVVFGGLVLFNNFFTLALPWGRIWRFWPVVLILIGLIALTKGKKYRWLFNAGIAAIAGFILFASLQHGCSRVRGVFEADGNTFTRSITAPMDSAVNVAVFRVDGGAGSYRIEDTTGGLLQVQTRTSFGHYFLKQEYKDSIATLELALKEGHISWQGGKFKNAVKVSLNPGPLWALNLNLGAASVNLDLTPYRIETMDMDAGAASIRVKLGNRSNRTKVRIDAGASSIKILVPEEAGCQITSGAELSSNNFVGFTKLSDRRYQTPNFSSAAQHIYLELSGGISNIEVRRYPPEVPVPPGMDTSRTAKDTGGAMF